MTWKTETDAQNVLDLAGRLRNYVCGYKENNLPVLTGSGSGTLDAFGADNTLANQTITITCTDDTTEGAEVWSVSGSIIGSLSSATSNVLYEDSGVTFIISSDSTGAFDTTSVFTVVITGVGDMDTSGEAATLEQHDYTYAGTALCEYKFQVEFVGAGSDTINICIVAGRDKDNDRFYVRVHGTRNPNLSLGVDSQPNSCSHKFCYVRNQPMTHWIIADEYGFNWAIQAGTTSRLMIARYMTQYASTGAYPGPLVIGGDSIDQSSTFKYSTQDSRIRFCVDPAYQAMSVLRPDNTWLDVYNYLDSFSESFAYASQITPTSTQNQTHPYGFDQTVRMAIDAMRPDLSGKYPMIPIKISMGLPAQWLGELFGIAAVPGHNTLTLGDIVQCNTYDWLVIQNIHRNNNYDFVALRLL